MEGHNPAEFSSSLDKNSPACIHLVILKTLIALFRCV